MIGSTYRYWFAAGVFMLAGCKQTVVLQIQAGGKPLPYVKQGDKLQWTDVQNHPLEVEFLHNSSPCEKGVKVTECVVAKGGYFPYQCVGCADPAVKVGSNGEPIQDFAVVSSSVLVNSTQVFLWCDTSPHIVKADPAQAVRPQAVGDSNIAWLPQGGFGLTTFSITIDPGVCKDSTSFDQKNNVCVLLPDAPSTPITYKIHAADGCPSDGTGLLTIR